MNTAALMRCSRCGLEILDGAVRQTIGREQDVCCERCAAVPVEVETQPDYGDNELVTKPIG
jgi:hypothetical protein